MHSFIYAFFRKTTFGWSHQVNCLLFTEHYQSPKTNVKMFEFSPTLVCNACNAGHV